MSQAWSEDQILRIQRNQLLKEEDLWREREDYQEQMKHSEEEYLEWEASRYVHLTGPSKPITEE